MEGKGSEKMRFEDLVFYEFAVMIHSGIDRDHDIQNVHHRYLVSGGAVPADWNQVKGRLTPSYAMLEYDNGMELNMDADFFRVMQTEDIGLGEEKEPIEFLIRYLDKVEGETIGGGAIRWSFSIEHDDPGGWVASRFLRSEIAEDYQEGLFTSVTLNFHKFGRDLFFVFSTLPGTDDSGREVLVIACGVQFMPFDSNDELAGWLTDWQDHESVVLDILKRMLEVDNEQS